MRRDRSRFEAGGIAFIVWHEQWDANIHRHADQGVILVVEGEAGGKPVPLLRFHCFDVERSYVYAPEGKNRICRIDPIADGNPIGWSVRQLRARLPEMLAAAGYEEIAARVDLGRVAAILGDVERAARDAFLNGRRTVKHNRGTEIFEAGAIRFGLEMRDLGNDGGLAIHVLSDLVGAPSDAYAEETEILAFDCFRELPHYHYGPRNKNHRIYWTRPWCRTLWTSGMDPGAIQGRQAPADDRGGGLSRRRRRSRRGSDRVPAPRDRGQGAGDATEGGGVTASRPRAAEGGRAAQLPRLPRSVRAGPVLDGRGFAPSNTGLRPGSSVGRAAD